MTTYNGTTADATCPQGGGWGKHGGFVKKVMPHIFEEYYKFDLTNPHHRPHMHQVGAGFTIDSRCMSIKSSWYSLIKSVT